MRKEIICSECGGTGKVTRSGKDSKFGWDFPPQFDGTYQCPFCDGTGKLEEETEDEQAK